MSTLCATPDISSLAAISDDALIGVKAVAAMCGISIRHTWRLVDAGQMPAPAALGRLRRWHVGTLRRWMQDGCRPVREARRR